MFQPSPPNEDAYLPGGTEKNYLCVGEYDSCDEYSSDDEYNSDDGLLNNTSRPERSGPSMHFTLEGCTLSMLFGPFVYFYNAFNFPRRRPKSSTNDYYKSD